MLAVHWSDSQVLQLYRVYTVPSPLTGSTLGVLLFQVSAPYVKIPFLLLIFLSVAKIDGIHHIWGRMAWDRFNSFVQRHSHWCDILMKAIPTTDWLQKKLNQTELTHTNPGRC